jgi:hypothetical protein
MALGAHYQINQAANSTPTGTVDVARIDIYQSQLVHLVGDSSSAQVSPVWTILAWPDGAAHTQPTNPTTFDATYTFPTPGSYLIEFLVNNGLGVNATRFVVGVTRDANGLVYDDGVREPVFGERLGDDTAAGNDRGWAKAYEAGLARAMPAVSNVAALLAFRPNRHKHVHLLGYRTPGDGGGGEMYWDATSSATHNGGTIFQPGFGGAGAMGVGRWVRRYVGDVYATWFGAVADARGVSGGNEGDANMAAASNTLTCTNIAFTSADIGKTVSVPKTKFNPRTFTAQTTAGSRGVRTTGYNALDNIWVGEKIEINGTPCTVGEIATGTVAATTANLNLTGTGTKFLTELWVGCFVELYGDNFPSQQFSIKAISSDTAAVLHPLPRVTAGSLKMRVCMGPEMEGSGTVATSTANNQLVGTGTHFLTELVLRPIAPLLVYVEGVRYVVTAITDDTHATLSTNGAATVSGKILTIHPGSNTYVHHFILDAPFGASATGQAVRGARGTLVTTISGVSGGVATLVGSADYTVTDGPAFVFTDNVAADTAARGANRTVVYPGPSKTPLTGDTVPVGPNAYGFASELVYDTAQQRIEIAKSAKFVQAGPLTIDNIEVDLFGHALAYTFDLLAAARQFTNLWVGQPGGEIIRVSNTVGVSASGSTLRNIAVKQLIDIGATADIYGEFGGHGGVTGVRLGFSAGAGAGGGLNGFVAEDCLIGINTQASIQGTKMSNLRVVRSDGYAHFSPMAAFMNGADAHYDGANTAMQIQCGVLQGHREGIRIGSSQYANGCDTLQIGPGKVVLENFPSLFPRAIVHCKGNGFEISGLHIEMEVDDAGLRAANMGTWHGIVLGGPFAHTANDTTVFDNRGAHNGTVHDIYLPGFNTEIAMYGCKFVDIYSNFFDTSGSSSAIHLPKPIRNFLGGSMAGNRVYANLQIGQGIEGTQGDIDFLDGTGFDNKGFFYTETQNTDPTGSLPDDPRAEYTNKVRAKIYEGREGGAYTIQGVKTIAGTTSVTGSTAFVGVSLTGTLMNNHAMSMAVGAAPSYALSHTSGLFIQNLNPAVASGNPYGDGSNTKQNSTFVLQQQFWNGTVTAHRDVSLTAEFTAVGDTTPHYILHVTSGNGEIGICTNEDATAGSEVSLSIGGGTPPKFYNGDGAPNSPSEAAKLGETAVTGSFYQQRDGTAATSTIWYKNDTGWHILV